MNGHRQNIVDLLWSEMRRSAGVPPAERVPVGPGPYERIIVPGSRAGHIYLMIHLRYDFNVFPGITILYKQQEVYARCGPA